MVKINYAFLEDTAFVRLDWVIVAWFNWMVSELLCDLNKM